MPFKLTVITMPGRCSKSISSAIVPFVLVLTVSSGCVQPADVTVFRPDKPGLGDKGIPLIQDLEDRIEFLSIDSNILKPVAVASATGVILHVARDTPVPNQPNLRSVIMTSNITNTDSNGISVIYKGVIRSDYSLYYNSMLSSSLYIINIDNVICYPWGGGSLFYFRDKKLNRYINGINSTFVLSSRPEFITLITLYRGSLRPCLSSMTISTTTVTELIEK